MRQLSRVSDYGIVLLAAGSSTRLGTPKQLLVFDGVTLIQKAASLALATSDKVVVVVGVDAEQIRVELQSLPLVIVKNSASQEGIASSIRLGLCTLVQDFQGIKGVIFIVCDQPYLTSNVLDQLVNVAEETQKGIIACSYGGTIGIPALFKKTYFDRIFDLKGDTGAKKLIMDHGADVISIPFPKGNIDIDTQNDWNNLLQDH